MCVYIWLFCWLHRERTSVNKTINGFEEFSLSASQSFFMVLFGADLCAHASQIDELPLRDDQIKSELKRKDKSLSPPYKFSSWKYTIEPDCKEFLLIWF